MIVLLFLLIHTLSSADELVLAPGDVQTLEAPSRIPISVENGAILQIRDRGRQFAVLAKKRGATTITIGQQTIQVNVVSGSVKAQIQILKKSTQNFLGLRIGVSPPDSIQVLGQLHRLSDWQSLAQVAENHQISYQFLAHVDSDIQNETRRWLLAAIRKVGLSEDTLSFDPHPRVRLSSASKKHLSHYNQSLMKWGLFAEIQPGQISQRPSVMLDLVLAEIDKTFEREIGILWGQSEQTGVYKAKVLPDYTPGELHAQLNLIESEGRGQILARPSLLSRSGEKAEFHAGGEMPIRISGWGAQSVEWKKYGIVMNFHPTADNEGRMSISIETEVSIPNLNQTTDQLPIFEVNRVKSHFDLDRSRTVVISGLLREMQSEFRQGIPFLSSLPVLGRLFGSPKYQSRKTELVIFVTPRVLKPSELDALSKPTK